MFTPSIGLKLLVGGLLFVCAGIVVVSCLGAFFDPTALLLAALFGVLGLALSWVGFRTFRWVSLDDEALVYGGLLGRTRIRLADIEEVELTQALRVRAAGSWRVAIRMEQRGTLGQLNQALRKRIPGAFPGRTALPFRWRARRMVIGVNGFYVGLCGLIRLGRADGPQARRHPILRSGRAQRGVSEHTAGVWSK